ncbi:MAG: hypothetical protein AAGI91_12620 [Bacteroidota bacterium]
MSVTACLRLWRRGDRPVAPAVVLALLLAAPVSAQTVRLHVLADSVTVGERFEVAVAVEHAPGVQVVFPEPPGAAEAVRAPLEAGEAELLGRRRLPPAERGAVRVDSAVFEAATFALDSARVGPVPVRIVRGTDTTVVASRSAFVGVRSLVPADTTARPKGLAPLATFPRAWGPWLTAALLVLALLVALWAWLRQRRRRPALASALPAHEEATVRFDALAARLPGTPAAVKPFYVELSEALRTYLARTLRVPALEQTTRELADALAEHGDDVPEAAHKRIASVLRLADLAKFAEVQPDPATHATALTRAREAVAAIEAARAAREEDSAEGEESKEGVEGQPAG